MKRKRRPTYQYWNGKRIRIPRHSYYGGFYDENLSRAIGKPPRFRYSKKFLEAAYTC